MTYAFGKLQSSLAETFRNEGLLDAALEFYDGAMKQFEDLSLPCYPIVAFQDLLKAATRTCAILKAKGQYENAQKVMGRVQKYLTKQYLVFGIHSEGWVESYVAIADIRLWQNEYDLAYHALRCAVQFSKYVRPFRRPKLICKILRCIGDAYCYRLLKLGDAIWVYMLALKYMLSGDENDGSEIISELLSRIGDCHTSGDRDEEAANYYIQAIELHQSNDRSAQARGLMIDFGQRFSRGGRYREAAQWYAKSLPVTPAQFLDQPGLILHAVGRIGEVIQQLDNPIFLVEPFHRIKNLDSELSIGSRGTAFKIHQVFASVMLKCRRFHWPRPSVLISLLRLNSRLVTSTGAIS